LTDDWLSEKACSIEKARLLATTAVKKKAFSDSLHYIILVRNNQLMMTEADEG